MAGPAAGALRGRVVLAPASFSDAGIAQKAGAIVAAKNVELPELKHRSWQDERQLLIRCILAMRSDPNESSAFTCARDIEEGRSTFEEVANGRPVDTARLLALYDAWKVAEVAYKTALREEGKRSSREPYECRTRVEKAPKRSHTGAPPAFPD
jgi:hypothetical protein